jgi:hypothetical protein
MTRRDTKRPRLVQSPAEIAARNRRIVRMAQQIGIKNAAREYRMHAETVRKICHDMGWRPGKDEAS